MVLRHSWRDGEGFLEYRDDRRRLRLRGEHPDPDQWVLRNEGRTTVRIPADLTELLASSAKDATPPDGGNGGLPIFVELSAQDWWASIREVVRLALGDFPPNQYQIVRLLRSKWAPHTTLTLPIRLAIIGDEAIAAASGLRNAWWLQDPAVQKTGLIINELPSHRLRLVQDVHIAIANEIDSYALLNSWTISSKSSAFLIALGRHDDSDLASLCDNGSLRSWETLPSIIWLPSPYATPLTIEELLLGIVHDKPLHQTVAEALPSVNSLDLRFVSDPRANQALRMSDAFADIARRTLATEVAMPNTIAKEGPLKGLVVAVEPEERSTALELPADFSMERRGLVPLARAALASVARSHAVKFWGATVLGRHRAAKELEKREDRAELLADQHRRVDVRVERVGSVPINQLSRPASEALWVAPDCTLRAGQRYRLRLQIGRDLPGNLVRGERPTIDSVLPRLDREGYDLEVAFFPKDFKAIGRTTLPLKLPFLGASDAVYFDLQAPRKLGPAELRLGVYLENNLLQSFVLSALVGEEEQTKPEDCLVVRIDFSKSTSFSNIEGLGDRAFSFGMNRDDEESHTLLLKIGGLSQSIRIGEQALEKPLGRYRKTLDSASADANGNPIFSIDGSSRSPAEKAKFEETIRELAAAGRDLYQGLFNRSKEAFQETLREFRALDAKTLQFTRYDPNYVVPWPAIYDYDLPRDTPAQPAPVCDGRDASGAPCGHRPQAPGVYCANGFWGIRHCIEENLALGEQEAITTVRTSGNPVMRVADSTADGFGPQLVARLQQQLASANGCLEVADTDDFFDLLWKSPRPAIFMVLGHMTDDAVPSEPAGPRIAMPGRTKWLLANEITTWFINERKWAQPNTILLLMACNASQTDTLTLNDHVIALAAAGSAAIIGPEAPVFSAFACDFAAKIAADMLVQKKSLGEAVTTFRKALIRSGNPLAFVFTAFGDSDLVIT